jgi:hypothetical protein
MRTTLNLLTRNGLVYMDFQPHLTADQYTRLMELVKTPETADELRKAIEVWANEEGLKVSFEE